jgi:superfamily II DNA helicase RecQ
MPLVLREDFNNAVNSVLKFFTGITKLNKRQDDAFFQLIHRRDVFAILPTGFGKSLIFQPLPTLCRELYTMGYNIYLENGIVLRLYSEISLTLTLTLTLNEWRFNLSFS